MTAPRQGPGHEDIEKKPMTEKPGTKEHPASAQPQGPAPEYEELYSPSRPKEEQGFSPVTIAVYIVIGLLLVAGIGGSIIGFKAGPLGKPHTIVSQRSISTRTTFKSIQGAGWRLNMSMLLSPSVAYMKYTLEGSPIKLQMLGVHYKIGNGEEVPLKLPPAYMMFEPLAPKEETSRAFWLGGSPVYSITIEMRIDDGHEIRNETIIFK